MQVQMQVVLHLSVPTSVAPDDGVMCGGYHRTKIAKHARWESGVMYRACHRVRNAKHVGRESGVVCPVYRRRVPTIVARANGPMRLVSLPTLNAHLVAVADFQTFKDEMLIVTHVCLDGFLFHWAIQSVKNVKQVPARVFLGKILATCVPKENFKLHKELRHVSCAPKTPIRTALDKCRASIAPVVK